jgi:hypothetical protein
VLDAIMIQRHGIPTAVVGVEKLIKTTGIGMARAQGVPDLPMIVLDHSIGILEGTHEAGIIDKLAFQAAVQMEQILTL